MFEGTKEMNWFPNNDSPFWPIFAIVFRTLAVVLVLTHLVSTGYREGWVTRSDLPLVAKLGVFLLTYDGFFVIVRIAKRLYKKWTGGDPEQ